MARGDAHAALTRASSALAIARRSARDERHSADAGEAALLRAQALVALGRLAEAVPDARLAVDALGHGLAPDHALTTAATAVVTALSARLGTQP